MQQDFSLISYRIYGLDSPFGHEPCQPNTPYRSFFPADQQAHRLGLRLGLGQPLEYWPTGPIPAEISKTVIGSFCYH